MAVKETDSVPAKKDLAGIEWREWSDKSFQLARETGRLVLLDLTATWCHWCHVMDDTTYSDPQVVRTVNEGFVPVRVDIDLRPDISERYNMGGFPTTAFLSCMGVTVWGATYVPPADMLRVMTAVLEAKRSGELDKALAGGGKAVARGALVTPAGRMPSRTELDGLLDGIIGAYDVEHGGFGGEPKFPHPGAVDLLITRHLSDRDEVLSGAATHTLRRMADGLYDRVEGGVFRYSVSRDWSVPHYEKMLETNLGFLRNLARAHVAFGDDSFKGLAGGVADYLLRNLRDGDTGAFFGSQDADEQYYGLGAAARAGRRKPSVDRTVYSGWNALASQTLIEAGVLLDRDDLTSAGLATLDHLTSALWDPGKNLVRHSRGQDLFLSEDQVELLGALIAGVELRGDERVRDLATRLVDSTRATFSHKDGGIGDVPTDSPGIGSLSRPIRSLVTNSKWAHRLALFGELTSRPELVEEAGAVIRSFDLDAVRAHGVFSADYIAACDALVAGPAKVDVRGPEQSPERNALWLASKKALSPSAVTVYTVADEASAVVCSHAMCSARMRTPDELVASVRHAAREKQV